MTAAPSVTLVTGATGFLGSAVVARLVERGWPVRCVVRGAAAGERASRLHTALGGRARDAADLIEIAQGDLSRERLGLPATGFAALGRDVTHIIHCGARVNMALPYASLYEANVRATEELLALAESRQAFFGYVGSLAAVANGVTGEPFELRAPVSGGYAQSKWSADRLVSVAHQEGRVQAAIFRPGRVTGDSVTGRSNPDDLLELVIRACVRLGTAPALTTEVRLTPVDWVSEMIAALTGAGEARGKAYHLVSARPLAWSDVVAAVRAAGRAPAEAPYRSWRAMVADAGRADPELARLAVALPAQALVFDRPAATHPRNARTVLAEGYHDPPPAEAVLAGMLAVATRTGEPHHV